MFDYDVVPLEHVSDEDLETYLGYQTDTLKELLEECKRLRGVYKWAVLMTFNCDYQGSENRHRIMSEMLGGGWVDLECIVTGLFETEEECQDHLAS